jgi:hypothetical protein
MATAAAAFDSMGNTDAKQQLVEAECACPGLGEAACVVADPPSPSGEAMTDLPRDTVRSSGSSGEHAVVVRVRQLLSERAQGNQAATHELVLLLEQFPELSPQLGDAGQLAIHTLARTMMESDAVMTKAVLDKATLLRKQLTTEGTSQLEKLLIDQVVYTWLKLSDARMRSTMASGEKLTARRFHAQQERQAHLQHAAALRELAAYQRGQQKQQNGKDQPQGRRKAKADHATTAAADWIIPFPQVASA